GGTAGDDRLDALADAAGGLDELVEPGEVLGSRVVGGRDRGDVGEHGDLRRRWRRAADRPDRGWDEPSGPAGPAASRPGAGRRRGRSRARRRPGALRQGPPTRCDAPWVPLPSIALHSADL